MKRRFLVFGTCLALLPVIGGAWATEAMATKVLMTNGQGTALASGAAVEMFLWVNFLDVKTNCQGYDSGARIGKNPAGALRVSGSGVDVPHKLCRNTSKEFSNGGMKFIRLTIPTPGAVIASVSVAAEASNGCKYQVKALKTDYGEASNRQAYWEFSGSAPLQKHVNQPTGCSRFSTYEAQLYVGKELNTFGPNEEIFRVARVP